MGSEPRRGKAKMRWWEKNSPRALALYGLPILPNGAVNHEMLGASLGELPFSLVFDSGWWFYDYAVGAFTSTKKERVEFLYKIIVGKAAEVEPATTRNLILGLRDHAKKVLGAAQVILEVDPSFWERHRRIINGNVEVFSPKESCKRFAEEAVTMAEGRSLALREAFGFYTRYCRLNNAQPLPQVEFQKEINAEFDRKFGVRLRHDLPSGEKGTRGWTKLALKDEFLQMTA